MFLQTDDQFLSLSGWRSALALAELAGELRLRTAEAPVAFAVVSHGSVVSWNETWAELNMPLGEGDEWTGDGTEPVETCVDLDAIASSGMITTASKRWLRELDGTLLEVRFLPVERSGGEVWLVVATVIIDGASFRRVDPEESCH